MNWDAVERAVFMVAALLLAIMEIKMILIDGRAAIPIFATLALCVAMLGAIDKDDWSG